MLAKGRAPSGYLMSILRVEGEPTSGLLAIRLDPFYMTEKQSEL
jgi:hypothetical protein